MLAWRRKVGAPWLRISCSLLSSPVASRSEMPCSWRHGESSVGFLGFVGFNPKIPPSQPYFYGVKCTLFFPRILLTAIPNPKGETVNETINLNLAVGQVLFLTQRRRGAEKTACFEFFESYLLLCNPTPSTPDG